MLLPKKEFQKVQNLNQNLSREFNPGLGLDRFNTAATYMELRAHGRK